MTNKIKAPDQLVPSLFDKADRLTIVFLALLLIASAIAFFFYVQWHGLLDFSEAKNVTQDRYFLSALEFRERRLSLVLTYRTFLTTLGFTVGLVLAALGGLFLLRRATMELKLDGNVTGMQNAKVSLILNSPGVAFMLGGVAIIIVTQLFALPIGAPEIFPRDARALCSDIQVKDGSCSIGGNASRDIAKIDAYCDARPDDEDCIAMSNLNTRLEIRK